MPSFSNVKRFRILNPSRPDQVIPGNESSYTTGSRERSGLHSAQCRTSESGVVSQGLPETAACRSYPQKKATEFEDQIEIYIREKPLKSVLIAAGVGALLGFLISRR